VRTLASALVVAAALALPWHGRAGTSATCPHDPSLGAITFERAGHAYLMRLGACSARVTGKAPAEPQRSFRSRQGRLATIVTRENTQRTGSQTITVDGRPVLRLREVNGVPGPLGLVGWSPDGRWLLYYLDPMGSASIAADGLELRALNVATGKTTGIATMLLYSDYVTWCGSTLVLTAGHDRIATHDKRLVAAHAPVWKTRPIWSAPGRAFGSVACSPDGRAVAVLSQPDSDDARFFATRWELWRVGLDGSHTLLDRPPPGSADESPVWSPDGRSLAFVRERAGHGSVMVRHGATVHGPLARLGYSLGFYGHHAWQIGWAT
jgi:dipeptidyl aminopeptidase/acylaminoacyl peptidase